MGGNYGRTNKGDKRWLTIARGTRTCKEHLTDWCTGLVCILMYSDSVYTGVQPPCAHKGKREEHQVHTRTIMTECERKRGTPCAWCTPVEDVPGYFLITLVHDGESER